MVEKLGSHRPLLPKFLSWPSAFTAILVLRAVAPHVLGPDSPLLSWGAIGYFVLLLLATGFSVRNAVQKTLGSRSFWVFLAVSCSTWALDQWIYLYYEFGRHMDVPGSSIADPVLFLHTVPLIAAAVTLPNQHASAQKLYRTISNSLLLFFFWGFLYVHTVFPYQYLFANTTTYALRFDVLYLVENLTLVAVVSILSLRMQFAWKPIYLHLLGASTLYALSSAVANAAIDSGGYVSGNLYGLGLTASACWFIWIPLRARQLARAETVAHQVDTAQNSKTSAWTILAVVAISIPMVWEMLQKNGTAEMRAFHLTVAAAAIVCLASLAYAREYFARSELIAQLGFANERLRLAMESSKSVGWDWHLKAGRISWFGDLQTMFGISSNAFVEQATDFYHYVHPEDRAPVEKAVVEARQSRSPYQAEFRVIRLDGEVRWLAATGQFYYENSGSPLRMLGMVVDVTDERAAQESLRLFRRLIDESHDAIEVIDPGTLSFLDVNDKCCRDLGYTREELLSLSVFDVDPALTVSSLARVKEELDRSGFSTLETLHQRKDGTTYEVEINLRRVELDRLYNVNVVRDITERKRVEETLRQNNAELTEARRLAGLGSWHWDQQTRDVIWSEELYRLVGYNADWPSPNPEGHSSFLAGESWDRLQRANQEAFETGTPYELDVEFVGLGMVAKWAIVRGEPLRDAEGPILGVRGTIQDITERKRAEDALRESQDKLRLILDSTAEAIYGSDLEGRCIFCNPACLRMLGYENVDEILGKDMHQLIHGTRADGTIFPVDECRIAQTTRTGEGVHVEDEVLWRADGTCFPVEYWCHPQWKGQVVVGTVVAFVDITERKRADAALASVSGKLIAAQEQERSRIARELHDDIGQRLALLAIGLAQLRQDTSNSPELLSRIGQLQRQTAEISVDIQSLSHELHSSRLQYLGLAAAIEGFCKEFGNQHKVEISFDTQDLPGPLSADISLCLFRVLQEALQNAAQHSGARHFEVRLWGAQNEIHLTIRDHGAGFELDAAKASHGLGLVSMDERVKLLQGTLSIESRYQRGATIHARVPYSM